MAGVRLLLVEIVKSWKLLNRFSLGASVFPALEKTMPPLLQAADQITVSRTTE